MKIHCLKMEVNVKCTRKKLIHHLTSNYTKHITAKNAYLKHVLVNRSQAASLNHHMTSYQKQHSVLAKIESSFDPHGIKVAHFPYFTDPLLHFMSSLAHVIIAKMCPSARPTWCFFSAWINLQEILQRKIASKEAIQRSYGHKDRSLFDVSWNAKFLRFYRYPLFVKNLRFYDVWANAAWPGWLFKLQRHAWNLRNISPTILRGSTVAVKQSVVQTLGVSLTACDLPASFDNPLRWP